MTIIISRTDVAGVSAVHRPLLDKNRHVVARAYESEPTGAEKVQKEMQSFFDKTAKGTTALAEKTASGARMCMYVVRMCTCVYVYVFIWTNYVHVRVFICMYMDASIASSIGLKE